MSVKLPEFVTQKYGSTLEEVKRAKSELENIEKGTFLATDQKGYSASEIKELCKAAGIEYLDGYETRTANFVISTEDVDRDSDIVVQKGIDLADYKKNPVILFAHNGSSIPIGVSLKVWRSNKQTKALALFFDDRVDKTGLSDTIYTMVRAGAIKGASIGFAVKEAHFPDEKEMKELGMTMWGIIFDKTVVLEWSVCSVPANQNSLREGKSMYSKKHLKAMKEFELAEKDDIDAIVDEMVKDLEAIKTPEEPENDETEGKDGDVCHNTDSEVKELLNNIVQAIDGLAEEVKTLKSSTLKGVDESPTVYDDLVSSLEDAIKDMK